MSNINCSKWLSGMNCVGYTPQEHQKRLSDVVLHKQLRRDKLLKEFWIQKFDDYLAAEARENNAIANRDEALMRSK